MALVLSGCILKFPQLQACLVIGTSWGQAHLYLLTCYICLHAQVACELHKNQKPQIDAFAPKWDYPANSVIHPTFSKCCESEKSFQEINSRDPTDLSGCS